MNADSSRAERPRITSPTPRRSPRRIGAPLATIASVAVAAGILGACSGGDGGTSTNAVACPATPAITVTAHDTFRYTPDALTVKAGTVIAELREGGALPHTFQIHGADGKAVVNGNTSKSCAKFTLKAGTYTFYCGVAGHETAGMKGKLTVS